MFNQQAAEDFCQDYGRAMLGGGGARAIVDFYGFPYVSFSLGHISQFNDRAHAEQQVEQHLARFTKHGLGHDVRLQGFSVEPVSPTSALCHLRWGLHIETQATTLVWDNVYGLRQTDDGQYFEFNISDNEVAVILQHCPEFFS